MPHTGARARLVSKSILAIFICVAVILSSLFNLIAALGRTLRASQPTSLTGCGFDGKILGVHFPKTHSESTIEFTFLDSAKRPLGHEIIPGIPAGTQSLMTQSIMPASVSRRSSNVSCAIVRQSNPDILSLNGAKCKNDDIAVVDNGATATMKQAAIYNAGFNLMLSASIEKFFAYGTFNLEGLKIFAETSDGNRRSAVALNALEPETVVLSLSGLAGRRHEVIFGVQQLTVNTVAGRVCY